MAEDIYISPEASKGDKYQEVHRYIHALTEDEKSPLANIGNTLALLHHAFKFLWTGCYIVKGTELVLGPFQGPVACTRISYGRGVCGLAWEKARPILVPDVEAFPGHIACSSASRSEIVIPLWNAKSKIIGVLDIDSEFLGTFDETDLRSLEPIALLLGNWVSQLSC